MNLVFRRMLYFFFLLLVGCTNASTPHKKSTYSDQLSITEKNIVVRDKILVDLIQLDKSSLKNFSASIRSRSNGRLFVWVSHTHSKLGSVALIFDNNHNLVESNYENWNAKEELEPSTIVAISKSISKIGLFGIAVDSCNNTFFSISSEDHYQYAIIEDSTCLLHKYSFQKIRNKVYSTQFSDERR